MITRVALDRSAPALARALAQVAPASAPTTARDESPRRLDLHASLVQSVNGPCRRSSLLARSTTRPKGPARPAHRQWAPVRLTCPASWMPLSSPNTTTQTVSSFELKRHAAHPVWKRDQLKPAGRGRGRIRGQCRRRSTGPYDFCNIGLSAEIGHRCLSNRRDLRRANFPIKKNPFQSMLFNRERNRCSLLLNRSVDLLEPV